MRSTLTNHIQRVIHGCFNFKGLEKFSLQTNCNRCTSSSNSSNNNRSSSGSTQMRKLFTKKAEHTMLSIASILFNYMPQIEQKDANLQKICAMAKNVILFPVFTRHNRMNEKKKQANTSLLQTHIHTFTHKHFKHSK